MPSSLYLSNHVHAQCHFYSRIIFSSYTIDPSQFIHLDHFYNWSDLALPIEMISNPCIIRMAVMSAAVIRLSNFFIKVQHLNMEVIPG